MRGNGHILICISVACLCTACRITPHAASKPTIVVALPALMGAPTLEVTPEQALAVAREIWSLSKTYDLDEIRVHQRTDGTIRLEPTPKSLVGSFPPDEIVEVTSAGTLDSDVLIPVGFRLRLPPRSTLGPSKGLGALESTPVVWWLRTNQVFVKKG